MRSVRTAVEAWRRVLHRELCPSAPAPRRRAAHPIRSAEPSGVLVLDVIYRAATLALFALVGLIAKAVERL
jgi:hypothetical protein